MREEELIALLDHVNKMIERRIRNITDANDHQNNNRLHKIELESQLNLTNFLCFGEELP